MTDEKVDIQRKEDFCYRFFTLASYFLEPLGIVNIALGVGDRYDVDQILVGIEVYLGAKVLEILVERNKTKRLNTKINQLEKQIQNQGEQK